MCERSQKNINYIRRFDKKKDKQHENSRGDDKGKNKKIKKKIKMYKINFENLFSKIKSLHYFKTGWN